MSFEITPAERTRGRPRGRGCGCLMMILGFVVAFMVVQAIRSRLAPRQQAAPGDAPEIEIGFPAPGPRGQPGAASNDWSIEDVELRPTESDSDVTLTIPQSAETGGSESSPKRTTKGDWTIEELEAQKASGKSP